MKVYIIPDLDLSVNTVIQVQNILLKVIEEPPEHTAIILTARSKEIFLPTIISRVLSLGMTSVTEAESMACLQEKYPATAPALISEAVSAGRKAAPQRGLQRRHMDSTGFWQSSGASV